MNGAQWLVGSWYLFSSASLSFVARAIFILASWAACLLNFANLILVFVFASVIKAVLVWIALALFVVLYSGWKVICAAAEFVGYVNIV